MGKSERYLKPLNVVSALLLLASTALVFLYAPREATMGEVQRIFYFHVPSAWVGMLAFAVTFVAGIVYLRTTREKTSVIYPRDQRFPIGGSAVVRASDRDQATIVAAGITVHEAIAAQQVLAGEGIAVRVIDAYSVKPVDEDTLRQAARETRALVVAEDHWAEGGLGEAVLAALAGADPFPRFIHLAVRTIPGSGTPQELLDAAGISAGRIAEAVRTLVVRQSAGGVR